MKKIIETSEAAPYFPCPMTRAEAEADGFTVDTGIYPWFAYKGPRFDPTDRRHVITDAEAMLFKHLANVTKNMEHFGFIYGSCTANAKKLMCSIGSIADRGQVWLVEEVRHESNNVPG